MSLVLAAAASALVPTQHALSWEGTAEVYALGKVIRIAVRTRIDAQGDVIGESWPVDIGEARGMHRMTLNQRGGTIDVGGKVAPMPVSMWTEEKAQYGFYRQLQVASVKAPGLARRGNKALDVSGLVTTRFRFDRKGTLLGASNFVPVGVNPTPQTFRFDGFWRSRGAIFPRHMEMFRAGRRYFTLDVTRFDAR